MDSIFIWASKVPGVDSATHFWFQRDGVRYRICDGERWIEEGGRDNRPDFPVPCGRCKETYLEDVLRGNKILHLLPEVPATPLAESATPLAESATPLAESATPLAESATPLAENVIQYNKITLRGVRLMVDIPMSLFARFYESRPADQVRIVRDIRQRMLNPDEYVMRDPYLPIRNFLRDTHWATGNFTTVEDAFQLFMSRQSPNVWTDRFRSLGELYMDYWRYREASHFFVTPVNITINELNIRVGPEIGMQVGGDYQVIKVWLNTKPPSRQALQIFGYLMNRAREQSNEWGNHWHNGVWDVARRNIPLPQRVARDFELGLIGQSAAFMQIWNELEQQALDIGE